MKELTNKILDKEREYLMEIRDLKRENTALKAKLAGEPLDPLDLNIPNICFSLAKNWGKDDARLPVWKQQRIERGFDNTELWSLDTVIARFIVPRLEEFLRQTDGFIIWREGEAEKIQAALGAFKLYSEDRLTFTDEENNAVSEGLEAFTHIMGRLWY